MSSVRVGSYDPAGGDPLDPNARQGETVLPPTAVVGQAPGGPAGPQSPGPQVDENGKWDMGYTMPIPKPGSGPVPTYGEDIDPKESQIPPDRSQKASIVNATDEQKQKNIEDLKGAPGRAVSAIGNFFGLGKPTPGVKPDQNAPVGSPEHHAWLTNASNEEFERWLKTPPQSPAERAAKAVNENAAPSLGAQLQLPSADNAAIAKATDALAPLSAPYANFDKVEENVKYMPPEARRAYMAALTQAEHANNAERKLSAERSLNVPGASEEDRASAQEWLKKVAAQQADPALARLQKSSSPVDRLAAAIPIGSAANFETNRDAVNAKTEAAKKWAEGVLGKTRAAGTKLNQTLTPLAASAADAASGDMALGALRGAPTAPVPPAQQRAIEEQYLMERNRKFLAALNGQIPSAGVATPEQAQRLQMLGGK